MQIAKPKQCSDVVIRDFEHVRLTPIGSILAMLKGAFVATYIPATVSAGA
jgi:hypothetical protein